MTATVKFITTVNSKLSQLEVVNGQLIFVSDTQRIYLDFNNTRTEYSQIIVLRNEDQRLDINPVEGFYFVLDTNILWRYESGWIQLTTPPKENVVFINYEDLPEEGMEQVLYITENNFLTWNGEEYIERGTTLLWGTL